MNSSLLDLNDDCLAHIVAYLSTKDYLPFANVCTRFRNVMMINARTLYKRVELTGNSEELLLMQGHGDLVKNLYFKYDEYLVADLNVVFKTIGCLINLENATLSFTYPVFFGTLLHIIQDLAKLPLLKEITLFHDTVVEHYRRPDFTIPAGPHKLEKVLELLKLIADVLNGLIVYDDSKSLLKDCKFFLMDDNLQTDLSNILILKKRDNSLEEALGYIVPHLSSVEEMNFEMSQPSKDYLLLARVSKLQKIRIYVRNSQNCGPHLPFIAGMSSRFSRQLTDLSIPTLELSYDEAKEIARMVILRVLHCCFEEPRCLEHLPALKQLKYLSIRVSHSGVTNQLLAIIRGCTGLNVLVAQVNPSQLASDFILRAVEVLRAVRDPGNQEPLRLGTPSENQIKSEDLLPYLCVFRDPTLHMPLGTA